MDSLSVKGKDLAARTGRSIQNISEIRSGKAFPTIGDFVELIMAAEEIAPGFSEAFIRHLVGESQRLTISPEEFVNALDSSEIAAVVIAAGLRMSEKRPEYLKVGA
jgi:transcriptional regulator with XRE-family HTH domain